MVVRNQIAHKNERKHILENQSYRGNLALPIFSVVRRRNKSKFFEAIYFLLCQGMLHDGIFKFF